MTAALSITCAVVGLLVGSFLTVVIDRVPAHAPLWQPRARCPHCKHEITGADRLPVVSWLVRGRRCRHCEGRISMRYPLVEMGTAALFAAAALRFGADWALPAYLLFFAVLLAVSVIDLDHFLIPNRIVYPCLFASVPLLAGASLARGDADPIVRAVVGAVLAWTGLLVIHLVNPRGMGFGDVRLAAVIGLFLGWLSYTHVLLGIFLGFAAAAIIGIGLLVAGRKGRKDPVPFGPFLALGAVLAVLVGNPILDWWLGA